MHTTHHGDFVWADDKVGVVFLAANVSFSLSARLLAKSAFLGKIWLTSEK